VPSSPALPRPSWRLVAVGPVAALLVIGAVLLVQQVEGNVLYPMIVGRTVDLHPVAILLAVTVGGLLYGIVGAALAVPVATVVAATVKVGRPPLRPRRGRRRPTAGPGGAAGLAAPARALARRRRS
jgi:predicted PurR-regulated permease PerM